MEDYLQLKREILETAYPLPSWLCIEPEIGVLGITTDPEIPVDDTKTLPRIENRTKEKAKAGTKRKRKSTKQSMRPKRSHRPNVSYVHQKNVKVIQTSAVSQTLGTCRFNQRFCHGGDCTLSSSDPGRGRRFFHRFSNDTSGTCVDVCLKDRGE